MTDLMPTRAQQLQETYDGLLATGRLLVSSVDGTLSPSAVSDDVGLYLVTPALARLMGVDPLTAASWILVGMVVLASLTGITGWILTLRTRGGKVMALVATALLAWIAIERGDVYVASVAALLAGVPWTVWLWHRRPSLAWTASAGALLGAWAGVCNLFRSHSGTALLLFALTGTLLLLGASRKWKMVFISALVGGVLIVSASTAFVVGSRNDYLASRSDVVAIERAGHPFWHTAYIGLGYLSNPYGIEYSDAVALEEAQSNDPDVVYLSVEYEAILRASYMGVASQHPLFFASTLAAKTGVLLSILLLVAGWALYPAIKYRKPLAEDAAFAAGTVFSALPGVVATPVVEYLTGFIAIALLWTVVTTDQWIYSTRETKA